MVQASNPEIGLIVNFDSAVSLSQGVPSPYPLGELVKGAPLPFVSTELLSSTPPSRLWYRHDLESFLYLLTAITVRFADGKELPEGSAFLDQWISGSASDIQTAKRQFLAEPNVFFPSQFKNLKTAWIAKLAAIFHKAYLAKDRAREEGNRMFDQESLGRAVRYEEFKKVLDS